MKSEDTLNHFNVLGRLTEIRQLRNMSVYKLAKLSGIPQSSIATWYQKELYPPIDKLEKLCDVLGLSLADFFNTSPVPNQINDYEGLLIQRYRLLSTAEQAIINSLIDAIINAHIT